MKWGIICFWEWANWIATCKNMNLEAAELRRLWAGGGWWGLVQVQPASRAPATVSRTRSSLEHPAPSPITWNLSKAAAHKPQPGETSNNSDPQTEAGLPSN